MDSQVRSVLCRSLLSLFPLLTVSELHHFAGLVLAHRPINPPPSARLQVSGGRPSRRLARKGVRRAQARARSPNPGADAGHEGRRRGLLPERWKATLVQPEVRPTPPLSSVSNVHAPDISCCATRSGTRLLGSTSRPLPFERTGRPSTASTCSSSLSFGHRPKHPN